MSRPRDTNPKSRAWGLFLLANSLVLERIETGLAGAGLPPLAWYDVLWELEKAGDGRLRMHELAERIVLPRYNLTRLADRLEESGLVRREDCAEDRRGYFLAITAAGRQMRQKMWSAYEPQIDALFARHLTNTQASALADALATVAREAKAPSEPAVQSPSRRQRGRP